MRLSAAIALGFALLGTAAAQASGCPGNPGAMGTSRVLKIDPRDYPRIGTVQYQDTLPLNDKEVVLTFDDGPLPPYTNRVLETLAHECVKANYFVVGRMARGYPELLRRIAAEGHVIGTHSENHPLAFEKMPLRAVQQEVDQGFASTAAALGGHGTVAPFFRIPGLLRADTVEGYLRSRSMVTWSADVVADDWKHITASEVVNRSIARLDARGKGILLLHDIQPATALALPHLLRELKRRGYKIVQVAPETASAMIASGTPRQPAPQAAAAASTAPVAPQATQLAAPQPPRETSSWPAPYPARTPPLAAATPPRTEPPAQTAVASRDSLTVSTTRPAQALMPPQVSLPQPASPPQPVSPPAQASQPPQPALETIVSEVFGAQAIARASGPPQPASPLSRAMPVPVIEPSRFAPGGAPSVSGSTAPPAVTRPLTPGFKPSHSASLPAKVLDLPVEPIVADPAPRQAVPAERPVPERQASEPITRQPQDAPAPEQPSPETPVTEPPAADTPPAAPERQIDTWSYRASLAPPPRQRMHGAWPVTASSLVAPQR